MTKEEAERAVESINNSPYGLGFCPLIKGTCTTNCVSFIKAVAYMTASEPPNWYYTEAKCSSPLVNVGNFFSNIFF